MISLQRFSFWGRHFQQHWKHCFRKLEWLFLIIKRNSQINWCITSVWTAARICSLDVYGREWWWAHTTSFGMWVSMEILCCPIASNRFSTLNNTKEGWLPLRVHHHHHTMGSPRSSEACASLGKQQRVWVSLGRPKGEELIGKKENAWQRHTVFFSFAVVTAGSWYIIIYPTYTIY